MQLQIFVLQHYEYVGWEDTITSGWGTTSSGGSISTVLQYVKVPPVSNDTCLDAFNAYLEQFSNYEYYYYNYGEIENPYDNNSMICAGKTVFRDL